jgi:hypothetical protein
MKSSNWFDFKSTYLSGNQYFGRYFVSVFLMIFIVPGIWLLTATVYKRSKSLGWSRVNAIFVAVIFPIVVILALISRSLNEDYSIFHLILAVIHFVLWFSDGIGFIAQKQDEQRAYEDGDLILEYEGVNIHGNDQNISEQSKTDVSSEKVEAEESVDSSDVNSDLEDTATKNHKSCKNSNLDIEPYEF